MIELGNEIIINSKIVATRKIVNGYLPSSNYTEYCIETETNKPQHFSCNSEYSKNIIEVWRRYSDIDLILTWLRKEFPTLIIPSLPNKT